VSKRDSEDSSQEKSQQEKSQQEKSREEAFEIPDVLEMPAPEDVQDMDTLNKCIDKMRQFYSDGLESLNSLVRELLWGYLRRSLDLFSNTTRADFDVALALQQEHTLLTPGESIRMMAGLSELMLSTNPELSTDTIRSAVTGGDEKGDENSSEEDAEKAEKKEREEEDENTKLFAEMATLESLSKMMSTSIILCMKYASVPVGATALCVAIFEVMNSIMETNPILYEVREFVTAMGEKAIARS
jgi:hypothetical protein